jgi:hypothetical protein
MLILEPVTVIRSYFKPLKEKVPVMQCIRVAFDSVWGLCGQGVMGVWSQSVTQTLPVDDMASCERK